MRRILLVGLLFLAGCTGLVGPRQRAASGERIDDPRLTIAEQEKRGRSNLALPDPDLRIGPRTGSENPLYRGIE